MNLLCIFILFTFSTFTEGSLDSSMPPALCEDKDSEVKWSQFMSRNYRVVFPDYSRNFGGPKWFKFCEDRFCPRESECDKDRMECCTHSYCPYSGASSGGAARRFNQKLLDYCINEEYSVSVCCSPCTCHLSPLSNSDMEIRTYKGMPTLFEKSCEECAAFKARMIPCTCSNPDQHRPVAILGMCQDNRRHSHGRVLNQDHYKTCNANSWDPMRGRQGISG